MSIKELSSKFLSLLRYVPYIIDENPKIERCLSCFPTSFKDRIEFDNPKTLEEAMIKSNFCYKQSKKREIIPNWKDKRASNFDKKEIFLSLIKVSKIILGISLRIIIK